MNANSYSSPGPTGGNREYVNDVITILEPEETPFTSMIRKGPAVQGTLIETQADILRKPKKGGSKEGADSSKGGNKAKDRRRFGTRLNRLPENSYGVTDVQQAISKAGGTAGVSDEFANSRAKALREAKRDIEAINCSTQEHYDGTEADMTTRGALCWLEAAGVTTLQTAEPKVPEAYRPRATSAVASTTVSAVKTNASAGGFTEDDLNLILRALQREHGPGKTFEAILGDNLIDKVDHFTRTNTASTGLRYVVNENASEHQITMMVKVFESSQGRCNFIPSQFINVDANGDADANAGLILWRPHWHMDMLEDLNTMDEPPTRAGQVGSVMAKWALLCDLPRGNGKIVA
jgi:hypothetical protein